MHLTPSEAALAARFMGASASAKIHDREVSHFGGWLFAACIFCGSALPPVGCDYFMIVPIIGNSDCPLVIF